MFPRAVSRAPQKFLGLSQIFASIALLRKTTEQCRHTISPCINVQFLSQQNCFCCAVCFIHKDCFHATANTALLTLTMSTLGMLCSYIASLNHYQHWMMKGKGYASAQISSPHAVTNSLTIGIQENKLSSSSAGQNCFQL